jgi:adenosylcobinamide-phosphate synthase
MTVAAALIGGTLVDAALGDPRRGHPVAGFGRAVMAIERAAYAPSIARGAAVAGASVVGAAAPVWFVQRRLADHPAGALVGALVIWTSLGGRSLWAIGDRLAEHLAAGDLEAARALVPSLAGRDPSQLDAAGIARAATESLAENTADAVLGTLVWGAAFGPAGAAAHRAANTLDAMHGHRSERYLRFGRVAARLDDALGFLPARVGAWLAVALAPLVAPAGAGAPGGRGATARAVRVLRRDGRAHPSPNAGPMEAAFAGALGLRLGGPLRYGTRDEVRPILNAGGRTPDAEGLRGAVRLSRLVSLSTLGAVLAARWVVARRITGAGR